MGAKGIAGLSHRSVAAEADVPLGSTTYHFKTLDELMVAALRQANEGFAKARAPRAARCEDAGRDLARGNSPGCWGSGSRATGGGRAGVRAVSRGPAPARAAARRRRVGGRLAELLARRTDPVTARALVALMDGICLQVLLTGGVRRGVRAGGARAGVAGVTGRFLAPPPLPAPASGGPRCPDPLSR